MSALRNVMPCIVIVPFLVGCTLTKCKLTGTPGAAYKGYHRMNTEKDRESDSGRLPDSWFTESLCFGGWDCLAECEYRKANTNDCLVVKVRTHGFKGTVTAPPGSEGVRVVREGAGYKVETF